MESLLGASMANLSINDRLQLLRALMEDDSSEGSSLIGDENEEGTRDDTGPEIASHQGANALMDTARQFVQNQPIVNAAIGGDILLLRRLLQQPGVNVDIRDGIGETALFAAICHDQFDAAVLLLESNADPNIYCTNGWSPLHIVARSGSTDLASLLLKWNANTAAADSAGWVPLHVASLYGTDAIVHILLEANANPNIQAQDKRTPLHTAVDYGHDEVIKCLVQNGSDLDAKDDEGRTPLHIAAMKRPFHPPVSLLLDLGARFDLADNSGLTALHMAVEAGHDPALAVKPLLQRGAAINAVSCDGLTPLLLAIRCINQPGTHRLAILETLVQAEAIDLNRPSCVYGTNTRPLLSAVEAKSRQAIEILTAHGADVKLAVDQDGKSITPALQAAAFHHPEEPELLQALLDAGEDPNKQMQFNITLAHIAALNGNMETLRLLIRREANINAADEQGGTPLHLAVRNRHLECIALLLQHGADVNVKANDRSTPLHDASRNADEDSIRLLLNAGADLTVTTLEEGLPSPIDILREKVRAEGDEEIRGRYTLILCEMMERLAERDPLVQEVRPDRQEGWLLSELSQITPGGSNQRPQGSTVADIRRRYQGS
ncbi:hypothetical protein IL306_009473 [Fusarium sp. DS 682]|nr:hypothetical protein IL306_009473 [Fusarium sp. DS 682]